MAGFIRKFLRNYHQRGLGSIGIQGTTPWQGGPTGMQGITS